MAYLARPDTLEKRRNPALLMDGVKSILCLAYPYPNPVIETGKPGTVPTGKVAAYARIPDYHINLPFLIDRLMSQLKALTGLAITYRSFTDSAPILERELACRAGLGWIGKNGCLINREAGSNFLLSEVYLGFELPARQEIPEDFCGNCNRCVSACPTGCINPDRTIDAGKCIAYLTIEHKDRVPEDFRKSIGDHVFGCDICQNVCPWNRKHARKAFPVAIEVAGVVPSEIDLLDELKLDASEFQRKYRGTPLMRVKRDRHIRNVAYCLGNDIAAGGSVLLGELLRTDPSALVRSACAWALGQYGSAQAREMLAQALNVEVDETVKVEITRVL